MAGGRAFHKATRRSILGGLASIPFSPVIGQERRGEIERLGKEWRVPRGYTAIVPLRQGELSLVSALSAIDEWTISPSARVIIQLHDGEHPVFEKVVLRHPHGANIQIRGDAQKPDRVRLVCERPIDLLYVGQGHTLGMVDGITIEHTTPLQRGAGTALLADEGGVMMVGSAVHVTGFYYGYAARRNGVLRCDGASASRGGDCNFFAFEGGHINAQRCVSSGAADPAKGLGSGFVAEYGGSIDCEGATAEGNLLAGYTALSSGAIRAYRSRSRQNRGAGYYASANGTIVCHYSNANNNCGPAYLSKDGGYIAGAFITENDNMRPQNTCAGPLK